jgi:hypothetical protein
MANIYPASGLRATAKHLEILAHHPVSFNPIRVSVPWSWLLETEVTDGMEREVRRRLIEVWSEVDLADPLF